jgi:hypothetical protein
MAISEAQKRRALSLVAGDPEAFMEASFDLSTRLYNLATSIPEDKKDDRRYQNAVDEAIGRVLLALGKAEGIDMAEISEHTAASAQARLLRERAKRARNALQGQPIDAVDTSAIPPDQTTHEPFTGVHSHLHQAHGADDEDVSGDHYHALAASAARPRHAPTPPQQVVREDGTDQPRAGQQRRPEQGARAHHSPGPAHNLATPL